MNEPKRRGRPPKIVVSLTPEQVVDDIQAGMRVMFSTDEAQNAVAQAYADRVWSGQSESADRAWRIQRVKEALEGQGMSMEGVTLP